MKGNGNKTAGIFAVVLTAAIGASVLFACDDGGRNITNNDFHTSEQYAYVCDTYDSIFLYVKGAEELSAPDAITLDFSELRRASSYFVEYADNAEFDASVVVSGIKSKRYGLYNLELGQELYWRAATSEDGLKSARIRRLTVASRGPRNLYIDGVSNVRDIGGYASCLADGGKIRQGLLFRGGALDRYNRNDKTFEMRITDKGKGALLELGVRQEIDLRDDNMCNGPYVDGINYTAVPIPSATESIRFEEFAEEYKSIFTLIANADRAPVYLHCAQGADRTGICAFILLTVCGASYEDTARDYLFTNFAKVGRRTLDREFNAWYGKLDDFDGSTKADQAKSWLISKGLTAAQVERIRTIFVEGYIPQL